MPENISNKINTPEECECYFIYGFQIKVFVNQKIIFTDKVRAYARERTRKFCTTKKIVPEIEAYKNHVKSNPDTFFMIILDEAHYGATTNEENTTPYSRLALPWNSEEFPNVFVLLVSATPWNLLSVTSKIHFQEVCMDLKNSEIYVPEASIKNRKKFKLHHIQWSDSHESDLKIGKPCRIMVCLD